MPQLFFGVARLAGWWWRREQTPVHRLHQELLLEHPLKVLGCVLTQSIDSLELPEPAADLPVSGTKPILVHQVHGSLAPQPCAGCKMVAPRDIFAKAARKTAALRPDHGLVPSRREGHQRARTHGGADETLQHFWRDMAAAESD
jgi:hypothetical protein